MNKSYQIRWTSQMCSSYSNDELMHYGIKGQKWGVRRYQNEDGSLTEAGRARVAKTAGYGYLNPSLKDKKSGKAEARESVSKDYSKAYWKEVANGMSTNSPSEKDKKLWDQYKEKYASATLKDLGMMNTSKARKDVKRLFAEIDPEYKYDDSGEYDDDRNKKFKEHRKEVEHPIQTRLKRSGSKIKSVIDTAVAVKKLIPGT